MKPKKESAGYILLSRRLLNNWIYTDEKFTKAQAWIDLLFLANYKQSSFMCKGTLVKVEVGQLAIAQETLAAKWLWSRGRVIRFLNVLEMEQMIVQKKVGVINLISIINYKAYQRVGTNNGTQVGTEHGTLGGTHPNKVKERKESAAPISTENGLAPIKFIKP